MGSLLGWSFGFVLQGSELYERLWLWWYLTALCISNSQEERGCCLRLFTGVRGSSLPSLE
jgi:hypothetical protein